MAGDHLPRLSEIIPGWPEGAPDRGDELLECDPKTLGDLPKLLRSHMTLALQSARSLTFASPLEVKRRLELGHIMPKARKWDTLAMDANRHRIMVANRFGGFSQQRYVSLKVPSPETLQRKMALPEGGRYLILYGGGPNILSIRDKRGGGVAQDLAELREAVPVADVVFWHMQSGGVPPTLFSLEAGIGDMAGEAIAFPDTHFLDVARGRVRSATTPALSPCRLERDPTETGGKP